MVLVCGGRDYADADVLFAALDAIHAETPIECIVHGGARGADALADEWARRHYVMRREYPADWNQHGKAAGPIRNRQMLKFLVTLPRRMVVAAPGARGTADMVRIATGAGVAVRHVAPRAG